MKKLRAHKWWLAALVAALFVPVCSDPVLRAAHGILAQRLQRVETEKQNLSQVLQHLRDDAATAVRLSHELNAGEATTYLAPVDRRQTAAQFEPLAAASRLGRFTYTLLPEQPFKPEPALPDTDGLAQSALNIEADAPHDGDAQHFIQQLLQALPGRAQLQQLDIERMDSNAATNVNTPLAGKNVRLSATIDWLANASQKMGDQ